MHSQGIIFTLTEHSNSALSYRQLTRQAFERERGFWGRETEGERRARKEGGEPRAQIPFPLPFERHAAYQLISLYGTYIIAVQSSLTDWPEKSNILEKILSGLLPTRKLPYYIENISSSGALTEKERYP